MKISIIGSGYVGLVSGTCLAERGHEVVCVDIDESRVNGINAGIPGIHETGLPELLAKVSGTRLKATTDLASAVASTEVTFIAVGTPTKDGRIDLAYVERAAEAIGEVLGREPGRHTVVVKSTVIPGTTDGPVRRALERSSGKTAGVDFGLGMNPEFLTEGQAVQDFMFPDRIVIGGIDAASRGTLSAIYASFDGVAKIQTNNSTAEMIKYASNSLLATMISFSNEIARLSDALGDIDVADVMRGVHASLYLSPLGPDGTRSPAPIASFLEAGCGFGGSCLPKDVAALSAQARSLGLPSRMLSSVLEINQDQPDELIKLIRRHHSSLAGLKVAVLGLAFKPDTDDMRESPAFPIIDRLHAEQAEVVACDPVASPGDGVLPPGVAVVKDLGSAVSDADVVVLVTRWDEFKALDRLLAETGRAPLVVDGRRFLDPSRFARYEGIGRGARVGAGEVAQ